MNNPLQTVRTRIRQSIIPKILFIGLLVIFMIMPVSMIENLIYSRTYTKRDAIHEVSRRWGGEQIIAGPVLTVPYLEYYQDKYDSTVTRTRTHQVYFLPNDLNIVGDIAPEVRRRGIYDVLLYRTKFEVAGNFDNIDFGPWNVAAEDIQWDDAYLSVGIPDTRGIKSSINLQWNDTSLTFGPSTSEQAFFSSEIGARPVFDVASDSTHSPNIAFEFSLELNGNHTLGFIPIGAQTNVQIRSSWPHPGFTGDFLPDQREIRDDGFAAAWSVNLMERPFPQEWRGEAVTNEQLQRSYFGVNLVNPVDTHQQSLRSAKYASLFILLSFVVFFLIEIINNIRVHPIQYLLVGSAICLFYLLLVSLSEHIDFTLSYVIASLACIGLIGGYSRSVLTSGGSALIITLVLALLYSLLFVLLQLEEYALLVGALGLFLILATLMFLTRKIDWYNVNKSVTDQVERVAKAAADYRGIPKNDSSKGDI